jgi:DNA helicase HerA-like ATPase
MVWGRDLPGMGRQRPLLLVYEEAHSYLPSGQGVQLVEGYAGRAVRRVFREGRKYGVGAIVVSQRPSELDDTILSQCGTFISLRLSNTDDKSRVRSTMPESILGLSEVLPALRTGEALIVGEAVQIVSRARIPLIEPRPRSDDPLAAECWGKAREPAPDYDLASTGWRTQRLAKVPEPEGEESANGENTGAVN